MELGKSQQPKPDTKFVRRCEVTILREFCDKWNVPKPAFRIIDYRHGVFTAETKIWNIMTYGTGPSKTKATAEAANGMLVKLNYMDDDLFKIMVTPDEQPLHMNPLDVLNKYCKDNNYPKPELDLLTTQSLAGYTGEMTAMCTVGYTSVTAAAKSKEDALYNATRKLLCNIVGCYLKLKK